MLNTVIVGAAGRMGQTLARMVHEDPRMNLMGGTEHAGHPKIGEDLGDILGLGQLNVTLTSEIEHVFAAADAVIDFTGPEASCRHATLAAQARIIHVIGTTGFNAEQEAIIARAAHHATIIKSGNMSLGVNLLAALVEKTARLLDEEFDIEVLEMHHRHKVDAPSGTALMLAEAAAKGRHGNLEDLRDDVRHGITGARAKGKIGMAVLRGGAVVGDHEVMFASDEEILVLSHHAQDRKLFARGALAAARWGEGKKPGLYSMKDVLSLD